MTTPRVVESLTGIISAVRFLVDSPNMADQAPGIDLILNYNPGLLWASSPGASNLFGGES